MSPQTAIHRYGITADQCSVSDFGRVSAVWEVWVPNENRPHGRQTLTQGDVYTCVQWVAALRRLEQRAATV